VVSKRHYLSESPSGSPSVGTDLSQNSAYCIFKKNIPAEGPAALPEHQGSASCARVQVPSDAEPNPCEVQRAAAEAGSCLNYRPLAQQTRLSLQHCPE